MAAKKKGAAKKAAAKKSATKKAAKKAVKKSAKKKAVKKKVTRKKPTHAEISKVAQAIYEKRCAKGIPGDQYSDWAEAERQLST